MSKLKFNKALTLALIVGIVGYFISVFMAGIFVDNIGTIAKEGYGAGLPIVGLLGIAAIICTIAGVFKAIRILTYSACAINVLGSLLLFIAPAYIAQIFIRSPEIMSYSTAYIRMSAIIILIISIACIVAGILVKNWSIQKYIAVVAAAAAASVLLSFLMISGMLGMPAMGLAGAGFSNIVQPTAAVLPLILFNKEESFIVKENKTHKSETQYSYLEEYKKNNKG